MLDHVIKSKTLAATENVNTEGAGGPDLDASDGVVVTAHPVHDHVAASRNGVRGRQMDTGVPHLPENAPP